MSLRGNAEPRPAYARSVHNLTQRGFGPLQDRRYFGMTQAEDVVQQEGGTLAWGRDLKHDLQGLGHSFLLFHSSGRIGIRGREILQRDGIHVPFPTLAG